MIKVIINADDFGYCRAVNYGIVDAHKMGILTSTTLMTNMPGAEHAAQLAKENPTLGVGIHLVLTCGSPLIKEHRTIVDENGDFKKLKSYEEDFEVDPEEIYIEWKAQIEKFLSFGLIPTHLDSHHHINSFKKIYKVFLKLASEYKLPIRNNISKNTYDISKEFKTTDFFAGELHESMVNDLSTENIFREYESIEIMCHPAYIDNFILNSSSFVYPRLEELEILIDKVIIDGIKENKNIKLISYKDL